MSKNELKKTISQQRNYKVLKTEQAKEIALNHLLSIELDMLNVTFGLPEIDDKCPRVWNMTQQHCFQPKRETGQQ